MAKWCEEQIPCNLFKSGKTSVVLGKHEAWKVKLGCTANTCSKIRSTLSRTWQEYLLECKIGMRMSKFFQTWCTIHDRWSRLIFCENCICMGPLLNFSSTSPHKPNKQIVPLVKMWISSRTLFRTRTSEDITFLPKTNYPDKVLHHLNALLLQAHELKVILRKYR